MNDNAKPRSRSERMVTAEEAALTGGKASAFITDQGVVLTTPTYDADYVGMLKTEIPAHSRRYDGATHRWTVFEPYVDAALVVVDLWFEVTVVDRRPKPALRWAEAMFDGLPERLHDGVYRSLLRAFQADIGGDEVAARELTTEYERRQVAS
jgi:hypothetical protein